jgi:hypothetical protein
VLLTVRKFVDLLFLLSVGGLIGLIAADLWGWGNEGYVVQSVHIVRIGFIKI